MMCSALKVVQRQKQPVWSSAFAGVACGEISNASVVPDWIVLLLVEVKEVEVNSFLHPNLQIANVYSFSFSLWSVPQKCQLYIEQIVLPPDPCIIPSPRKCALLTRLSTLDHPCSAQVKCVWRSQSNSQPSPKPSLSNFCPSLPETTWNHSRSMSVRLFTICYCQTKYAISRYISNVNYVIMKRFDYEKHS